MTRHRSRKRGHRTTLATVILLTLAVLVACDKEPAEEPPVAVWEGGRLERAEFQTWTASQNLEPTPASIRKLAMIKSMAQAARERGATDTASVQLAAEAARHRILMPALDDHLDREVEISEDEIEVLRTAHPEAFQQPRKLFLRGIYKRLPENEAQRQAVHERMRELRERVLGGADLERLAAAESDSQSRFRDGSIGFVDPETLPPPVRAGVRDLEVGDVSELIELPDGLAFYACERIKAASRPSAEEVRHKFRQNLFRQKRVALNENLKEALTPLVRVMPDQNPVLRVGDYTLPREWITPLARQRIDDRDPKDLTTRQKQRLLSEWGFRVAMADHAESIGLADSEPLAGALQWRLEEALATEELRHRVDARLQEPDEHELRELFERRRERMRNPPAFRVAAIRFSGAGDGESASAIAQARETVARIQAGELGFEQAARAFSTHPSARNGGQLGWKTPRQLGSVDVRLLQTARALEPGEDSGLLRLESGLWLLKLLEHRDAGPMSFEQAREQLTEIFRKQQISRLETQVRARHLESMNLKIAE